MARVLLAFEPPDGGVAENIAQLAVGLRAHGWEVELAGPIEATAYGRAEAAGAQIHRLPWARGYGTPGADARSASALRALLREREVDLLHCHSAKAGVVGRLVGAAARVPVVYSPHCFPFIGDFGVARRLAATAIEFALCPLTRRIICVSQDERRQALAAHLPGATLHVVHNGSAPCDPGSALDAATAALAEGGPLVAAVAVMRPQKRLDVLIDAAPSILQRAPTASVAIIGDGPLRTELHAQAARLGLDAHPRFAFVPFAGPAARHLQSIDVFVLPSSWEGLPIGLLEAMSCGVPQVVTDVGGSSEAVTPATGVLVAPDHPSALADAVVEVLADAPRRAAMGAASRRLHSERFTVGRTVAETAAVYREALLGRRRPAARRRTKPRPFPRPARPTGRPD